MPELREAIALCCKKMRLSSHLADRAMTIDGATNQEYLFNLLTDEIDHRHKAKITKYLDSAEFPKRYAPEQFHTDEITFPETTSFQSLLALDFYRQGKNVIMYGGSGTGKTMLSILIGIAACNAEVPVKFYRTAGLINRFTESHQKGTLNNLKKKLNTAQLLILDEFGYVPYVHSAVRNGRRCVSERTLCEAKRTPRNTNISSYSFGLITTV